MLHVSADKLSDILVFSVNENGHVTNTDAGLVNDSTAINEVEPSEDSRHADWLQFTVEVATKTVFLSFGHS